MGACFPSNYYCISSQSSTFFVTFSANPFASLLFCRVCVGVGGDLNGVGGGGVGRVWGVRGVGGGWGWGWVSGGG